MRQVHRLSRQILKSVHERTSPASAGLIFNDQFVTVTATAVLSLLVKDFENRLINGEVMGKSRVSFYDSRGTLAMINKIWHSFSVHLEPVAKFRIHLLQLSAP